MADVSRLILTQSPESTFPTLGKGNGWFGLILKRASDVLVEFQGTRQCLMMQNYLAIN